MPDTHNTTEDTLQAALQIAAKGLRVFPIPAGRKLPASWRVVVAATSDSLTVRALFMGHAGNIGVATGECNAGRIVVMDVDGARGQAWIDARGVLPPTLESATGRDAPGEPHRHHFYLWPDGDAMPVDSATITDGVDVRGAGGFVVAPGSIVDGNRYRWFRECKPVPAPRWFVDVMGQRR